MGKLLLLIHLLLFSFNAWALDCGKALLNFNQAHALADNFNFLGPGQIYRLEKKVKCLDVFEVDREINAFKDLFKSSLAYPDELTLVLGDKASNAYFQGNLLSISTERTLEGKDINSSKELKAIWIHEYAHAIFDKQLKNLSESFKVYTQSITKELQLKILYAKSLDHYLHYKALNDNGPRSEYQELMEKYKKENITYMNALSKVRPPYGSKEYRLYQDGYAAHRLSLPYHELYADLVAVTFYNDPTIMAAAIEKVLSYTTGVPTPKIIESIRERDFTDPVNSIDNWQENHESHALFAPVRFYLFKNFLSKKNIDKIRLLKAVEAIALEEIKVLIKNDSALEYINYTPLELNKRFIDRLNQLDL